MVVSAVLVTVTTVSPLVLVEEAETSSALLALPNSSASAI